ncbi:hypothetical protein UFOVP998_45 [uncultured Caudovirales phage]|uniref:Uncharacterized protein n=1 Tax=uncultured Caudovirales phage TaxID=2100421 RepID=A0A6J5Q7I3_9CAUD|nr:hypothetical protein UFOVP998_45 [uncultured Caudovirales phage]CAB4199030.1 hypothetical protein UFOVP1331_14 [uncultured Caudovirales phage]CAB4213102.1 hypothetical protein UFOVP1442_61 [uncultured Caudovirales phage]CAB5228093.1 hypothetical protein UFOVP1535_52 [uncultured Caudovirales phage]
MALPCGTRAKYVAKACRCLLCRAANSRYETDRAAARKRGEGNGLVPATAARAHLAKLSRAGIGKRAVAAASDVALTVIEEVRTGRKTQIRQQTARKILAVSIAAVSDHALVPAAGTHRLLRQLLDEGFTKTELARRLGSQARVPALQLKTTQITAISAAKVERLYHRVMVGG